MSKSVKQHIVESVCGFRLPRYKEIPDMGLYLEQTTKYINGYLKPLGCMEITTSMLSNYVKKGLVPNPVKKQYFAEHIAYLFFVTIAKTIISAVVISAVGGIAGVNSAKNHKQKK